MNEKTYKSRCVEKFTPSKEYRDNWDRIFSKSLEDNSVKFSVDDSVVLYSGEWKSIDQVFEDLSPSPGSEDAQELGSPQHK